MSVADETGPENRSGWSPMGVLAGFDASLLALRDELTPGQRWTAGLASLLGLALLLYGQPIIRVVAPAQAAAPPAAVSGEQPTATEPAPPAGGDPGPGSQVVVPPPIETGSAPPPAPAEDPAPAGGTEPDTAEPPPPTTGPTSPTTVPLVTALVTAAPSGSVPGHTEQDVATAFLSGVSFNAVVEAYDPEATRDACDAAAERDVVLAGSPLPRQLRDCLLDAGLLVISHDDRGGRSGDGELVATRPGVEQVLLEAAAWGRDGALAGAVGLAVDPRLREEVEATLPALADAGVDVAAVEYVEDVRQSVLAFASEDLDVTAFLLPVALQREWATVASVVGGTGSYVVLDAADAVTTGGPYPPTFDGARSFGAALPTSPPTEEQADCQERWESTGGPALDADERFHVLVWCQLADLADVAAAEARAGTPFRQALAGTTFDSPLTTPLAPREDGTWGPAALEEHVWQTACGCWQEPDTAGASDAVGAGKELDRPPSNPSIEALV